MDTVEIKLINGNSFLWEITGRGDEVTAALRKVLFVDKPNGKKAS